MESQEEYQIKPDVLSDEEICSMVPFFKKHPKIFRRLKKMLAIDKVNWLHSRNCFKEGAEVPGGMIDDMQIDVQVDNAQVLDNLPPGAFITVSNHPYGAWDGIILTWLIGSRRPTFKVMVNMILNHISGMRRFFIAVDALASDDPAKRAVSLKGIKDAMRQVRDGNPMGFFPAGAVSKVNRRLRLEDRQWQPTIVRLIQQLKVPVIPIFFQGHNSTWFNILGLISWKLRTLRLPAEVFNKRGKKIRVTIGEPISVEEQQQHQQSVEEFGRWLKAQTYSLRIR